MSVNTILTKVNLLIKSNLTLLVTALILLFSAVFLLISRQNSSTDPTKNTHLVMRQIAHRLLLQSGDSSSRVLPVTADGNGRYELRFEREFSFMPDSLLRIVKFEMTNSGITSPYEVNVKSCFSAAIVYGFEIVPQPKKNKLGYKEIVPCLGREQPKACYLIQIHVQEGANNLAASFLPLLFLFGALFCFSVLWWSRRQRKKQAYFAGSDKIIYLGAFQYVAARQVLIYEQQFISLSDKENQVLSILAACLGELVSREELLKRVWEDEGVITGRSLDVFISKLRKKLQLEPKVQLNNVHGKGYKLEILP